MNEPRSQSAAVEDAETAAEWYETQRPGLGIEFILELDAAIEKAVETPEAYELKYRQVRRALTRRFPYSVYFVLESNVVEVFAILHQRRDSVHVAVKSAIANIDDRPGQTRSLESAQRIAELNHMPWLMQNVQTKTSRIHH